MLADIDLSRQATAFAIPVFLIQGEHDILTVRESTRAWFDSIQAPRKGYHLVPEAAHDFNVEVVNRLLEVLKREVLPLIGQPTASASSSEARTGRRN